VPASTPSSVAAGWSSRAPTFHSLRYSHGSALIAAGWDLEEVSARLGHASTATTMRAYIHAYDAARRSEDRRGRLAALYPGVEAQVEATGRTEPHQPGGEVAQFPRPQAK
jgi:integrase